MPVNDPFFSDFLNIRPEKVIELPVGDICDVLASQFGENIAEAFDPLFTSPSPLLPGQSTDWVKRINCVGINVRTIDNFWNVIPYAFTLPKAQNAIHILPIWEPGVVGSLYGMSSWKINPEFFSEALFTAFPHLDSVEKQLKVVVNLLHIMGKTVGMDVVPHTDRFAEQVLLNPDYFEWLQRKDMHIVRHDEGLNSDIKDFLFETLYQMGTAYPPLQIPSTTSAFFDALEEDTKSLMMFGQPDDYWGRLERRKILIQALYEQGFETVPATMAPPYRGIEVDPDEKALVRDDDGRIWRDYRITRPAPMSRVFGPLTRYKLYAAKDNNSDWELDFDRPWVASWEYVCGNYQRIQATYNFDFMRGDMSHVQMRPDGVPVIPGAFYDLLGAVKKRIQENVSYFGYFAESFMAPAGEMAYGDESDHLEASLADTTLGDLQSEPVGTDFFVKEFARYRHVLETRKFAPNFTIMTADKDDPRFDRFYLRGNEIRYFIALFLPDMPSYMGLGFECRDPHPVPAPNEHYTKLYVFQEKNGPKSTTGPYQWGQNSVLYQQLARQKRFSNTIHSEIADKAVQWVYPPANSSSPKIIGWEAGHFFFLANLDTEAATAPLFVPPHATPIFSTKSDPIDRARMSGSSIVVEAGEGIVFEYQN